MVKPYSSHGFPNLLAELQNVNLSAGSKSLEQKSTQEKGHKLQQF